MGLAERHIPDGKFLTGGCPKTMSSTDTRRSPSRRSVPVGSGPWRSRPRVGRPPAGPRRGRHGRACARPRGRASPRGRRPGECRSSQQVRPERDGVQPAQLRIVAAQVGLRGKPGPEGVKPGLPEVTPGDDHVEDHRGERTGLDLAVGEPARHLVAQPQPRGTSDDIARDPGPQHHVRRAVAHLGVRGAQAAGQSHRELVEIRARARRSRWHRGRTSRSSRRGPYRARSRPPPSRPHRVTKIKRHDRLRDAEIICGTALKGSVGPTGWQRGYAHGTFARPRRQEHRQQRTRPGDLPLSMHDRRGSHRGPAPLPP